jgi:hypothetical protein
MRSNIPLSINLPALFWKPLVGESPSSDDLEPVDLIVVKHLAQLKDMTQEEFDAKFSNSLTFTIFAGKTVDLIPGGNEKFVKYVGFHHFVLQTRSSGDKK